MKEEAKEDLSRLMHKLHKEVGDVAKAFWMAIDPTSSKGERISEEECKAMRKELREAMEVFQKLHSKLDLTTENDYRRNPMTPKQQEIERFGQVFSEITASTNKPDYDDQQRMMRAIAILYALPPPPYTLSVQEKK